MRAAALIVSWVVSGIALAGFVGCEGSSSSPDAKGPPTSDTAPQSPAASGDEPAAATSPAPAAAAADVNLIVADEKQFQEAVDSHRGKVVLVDFWATWCLPCVEHFPETVELVDEHADEGLAAVTVSFDSLDEKPAVEQFLKEVRAGGLDNLQSKYDGVGTEVPTAFDFAGVLPHYRLYDRTGKLRYRWDEPPADLKEKLAELLAEKPSE